MIGTISFAGNINESNEILEAENPNPLKPLTIEANNITLQKNINSINPKSMLSKNDIYLF